MGVCPTHDPYTGVYVGRVFLLFSSDSSVHGPYTGVYVERVSFRFPLFFCRRSIHGRVLGVCPIHGPYTGVYAGRVSFFFFPLISYTVSVHGRVSQPCTSLVFQNSLFGFLYLQFVLFLVSFHQIVSKSFINHLDRPPNTRYVGLRITPRA